MTPGFRPFAVRTFEILFRPIRLAYVRGPLIRDLAAGEISGDRPMLLVPNHASWWDGFVLREVQRRLRPGAPLFTVMTDRELRRHPWLRWLGCVGIDTGRRGSVLRAFRRLRAARRQQPRSVFLMFPQGAIWPSGRRPLGFERGVTVLASLLAPISILPVAIHIEPLNRARPTAFVALGRPVEVAAGRPDLGEIERAVTAGLDQIRTFLEEHGEGAVDRWHLARRTESGPFTAGGGPEPAPRAGRSARISRSAQ